MAPGEHLLGAGSVGLSGRSFRWAMAGAVPVLFAGRCPFRRARWRTSAAVRELDQGLGARWGECRR